MVIAPVTLVLHLLEKARRNACQDSRSPRDPPPGRHCLHWRGRHPPHLSPPSAPAVTGRGCRGEGGGGATSVALSAGMSAVAAAARAATALAGWTPLLP